MPDDAPPPFREIVLYLAVMILSVAELFFLAVRITSGSAVAGEAAGGRTAYTPGPGAYLSGVIFLMLVLYAGSGLFKVLFPNR